MQRRKFIQLSIVTGISLLLPTYTSAKDLDLSSVIFSSGMYNNNQAQTIIVSLYGGASQLSGNISNLDEIKPVSQNNYDSYFGTITPTANNCWAEAGGTYMEDLMTAGDMTIFRSCYSRVREANNNKAHGLCVHQNQTGSFDEDNAGIITNLAQILEANNLINENTIMPFLTLEGDSKFYLEGAIPLSSYLKPASLSESLGNNPYSRYERDYKYYTREERQIPDYNDNTLGFDAPLHNKMDTLAQQQNPVGKIKNAFDRRASLATFIDQIATSTTPDLGADAYLTNNGFAEKMETAIKVLANNPDTKVITLGTDGLGGWDNHDQARDYVGRMNTLFRTLKSAMTHIKAEGKENTINIMVFGDFGRNVNLNSANGWDHGNLQNFYVLGGKGYFNHKGIVGETILENNGGLNRLFLKPKSATYEFEPLSIAATIYKIYGVENPDTLTNGNDIVNPLFT